MSKMSELVETIVDIPDEELYRLYREYTRMATFIEGELCHRKCYGVKHEDIGTETTDAKGTTAQGG